ncbi:MAG: phage major capsid protein [Pseudomonadota bacterium]
MTLTSNERLQERLSLALEDRSRGYVDLVSNSNAILTVMRERGMFKTFSGPKIRERLMFAESGTYKRYSGFDFLNPKPAELINDAEFEAKLAAVSVVLANEEILKNSGSNQLMDVMSVHVEGAEQELMDRFVEDAHSDGTEPDQIGGFQLMLPTTPSAGTYGGISRADHALWRPRSFNAHSYFAGQTQVTSTSIKPMWNQVTIELSKGRKGPGLIAASQQHYLAYQGATEAIQRITDETRLSKLGFTALKFYGAGKSMDIVLEGGIGTAMPDDTSYFIDADAICFRYHPDRNFAPFGGRQTPVNQDAIVQHIGFMGELTLRDPQHVAKFYDGTPAS